ncbi:MAG: hypothetical protein J6A95_04115 [Clostridia bacterium]|nr:hypothetical protein [Clostridia bacterium]
MEKKSNGIVKGFLIVAGVIVSLAGAIAVLYTVIKKHFKFTIELCPDDAEICDCESEECICGCAKEDSCEEVSGEEDEISICPEGCECDSDVHCKKATEEE